MPVGPADGHTTCLMSALSAWKGCVMRIWTVDDVMNTDVVTATSHMPYRAVVDELVGKRVSALPVVDDVRRVTGVVSEADLLRKIEFGEDDRPPRLFEGRRRRAERAKADGRTAGDMMTSPAVTVMTGTPVAAAARLMDAEKVKRLPVVDDRGRLVGIVSRGDLLRMHLRPDADIRADVATEILHRVLVVEEGKVQVQVMDGVVTLEGRLDRRSAAELAIRLTRHVPGVVSVVDRLSYDFDDSDLVTNRGMPFGVA
jgi:CBS-domain-containing membrane protein